MENSRPLDELYLEWLYSQVCVVHRETPRLTYWNLFRILYKKEFVWLILNDDNRAQDGIDIRHEFRRDQVIPMDDSGWFDLGCSFLELLFGLSRRLEFETNFDVRNWFWHFLQVLELDEYNDACEIPIEEVDHILDTVIWRTYQPNGHGGLFPLNHAHQDQTQVEIWYQLNAYLIETDY